MVVLRDYQKAAVDACCRKLQENGKALLVMATGLGKTIVFSEIAQRYAPYGFVFVVSHREELVMQAAEKLADANLSPGIEMAEHRAATGMIKSRVVSASIQTLSRPERLKKIKKENASLLIIDEAHHASASTYRRVIDAFYDAGAHVLGVTATPYRMDGKPIFEAIGEPAYIYDLRAAIKDGWLVPITQHLVKGISVDLSGIKIRAGDYDPESLGKVIQQEKTAHAIARVALDSLPKGPVIVYCPSVSSTQYVTGVINRYLEGVAACVHGNMNQNERRAIISRFRSGSLRILCNCLIATEGFDVPEIAVIVMARPTRSCGLYTQIVGRGTRPLPGIVDGLGDSEKRVDAIKASRKPCLHVYDLIPANAKTKILTVADILLEPSAIPVADRVRQVVVEKLKTEQSDDGLDVLGELDAIVAATQEAIAQQFAHVKAKVRYRTKARDPLDMFGVTVDLDGEPATQSQREWLAKHGIRINALYTRRMADEMIAKVLERNTFGLASYKQVKMLTAHKVPPQVAEAMTKTEAGLYISNLEKNGFKFLTIPVPKTVDELEQFRNNGTFASFLRRN